MPSSASKKYLPPTTFEPNASPATSPPELTDGESDYTLDEPLLEDLDEPWPFTFTPGEQVWIRTLGGQWIPGRVTGQKTRMGPTRQKDGIFYPVLFCENLRKHFAPLNGEIKPNTPQTRRLLKDAGWL